MSEPPGNSSTATFTNTQMSNLYWCDQCGNAVRITSPHIQCPECNNLALTPLRNPEFRYNWSNVDGIRPPRLPPQPIPRRQNYSINNSRSGGSAITSLLSRPRPQRRLLQSLRNQEIGSALRAPIPSTHEVQRMAEREQPITEIDSAAPPMPSSTIDPAVAVNRSPSSNFLRPPGFNTRNFVRGPEINIISSMVIGIAAERAVSQQARQPQVVPQLEAPPEQPASPQSPQVVPQLEAPPEQPASPQAPQVVPQLEAEPGPSSMPSTVPALMPGSVATVIVKREDVNELNNMRFCGVCLDDFEVGENVLELLCNHRFHNNCIDRWMYLNHGCPDCRSEQLIRRIN